MADKRALYQQIILDHNKSPRNFGPLKDASCAAEGYNALCGDRLTLYLKLNGDVIEEVAFQGCGCAISKASASLMTLALKGKTKKEAEAIFCKFHAMVTSRPGSDVDTKELGKLEVLCGVRDYPVRVKCATLAWHTMLAALDGKKDSVTTE